MALEGCVPSIQRHLQFGEGDDDASSGSVATGGGAAKGVQSEATEAAPLTAPFRRARAPTCVDYGPGDVAQLASRGPGATSGKAEAEGVGHTEEAETSDGAPTDTDNEEDVVCCDWVGEPWLRPATTEGEATSSAGATSVTLTPGKKRKRRASGAADGASGAAAGGSTAGLLPHFNGININGHEYMLNSFVYMRMSRTTKRNKDQPTRWIGQVLDLWETEERKKRMRVRWMYYPEETQSGRCAYHLPHELFATNHTDENDVGAIDGPAYVLRFNTFCRVLHVNPRMDDALAPVYTCRYYYDFATRLSRDIAPLADGVYFNVAADCIDAVELEDESGDEADGADGDELEAAGARTPSRSPVRPAVVVTAAAAEVRAGVDDAAWATTLSAAAKALQLSSVPHLLPCREKERGQITAFLRTSLAKGGLGSALYISGMPGTGKTSLVMEIIRTLSAEAEAGTLPAFKFVELNAMKLATPHDAYSQLASELLGVYAAATRAASLLDTHFRTANKQRLATVLLVDELDFLMTRQQTVIYNLFNWPQYANSKLIIVSLANTMDLPERLLPKVASRLSPLRLVFQPYTREQLVTIMAARLTDSKTQATFEEDAVRLAAAKVAGTSGDVRRSLAICRRAVELLQADGGRGKVTPSHVHRASRDLLGSLIVSAVASCRPWEQNLLIAVALQQRATGCHVLSLVEVWERLSSLLSSQSFHKPAHRRAGVTHATSSAASLLTPPSCFSPIPTLAECVSVAASLHRLRLLFLEPVKSTPWPNVRLAIGVSDVATALPDNELAQRVLA